MEFKEKILLMDCPPLGAIITTISIRKNNDSPFIVDFPKEIIDDSESLIGACFNFNSYDNDLDEIIDYLEELDLFDKLDDAVDMIKFYKDNALDGFSDIKVFTAKGLVGLIFRTPN